MNILITGGASGLGYAITKSLIANHNLYITYNKSRHQAQKLKKQFSAVTLLPCDFNKSDQLDQLLQNMGKFDIDVLINNAFTFPKPNYFHKLEPKFFYEHFQNNIIPSIKITQCAINIFRQKKFGKIITILTSSLINKPPVGWSAYVASKAYLQSLTKSWAIENNRYNITSNSISPSIMKTAMHLQTDSRIIKQIEQNHPLRKLLTPAGVAKVVLFLVEADQQINGTNIVINSADDVF